MSVFKARDVEKALLKKGFRKREGDHHYFDYFHNDKYKFSTRTSHNGQDIGDKLINKMKNQCKLNKKDFMDLINCPLSREDYEKLLSDNGHLK